MEEHSSLQIDHDGGITRDNKPEISNSQWSVDNIKHIRNDNKIGKLTNKVKSRNGKV